MTATHACSVPGCVTTHRSSAGNRRHEATSHVRCTCGWVGAGRAWTRHRTSDCAGFAELGTLLDLEAARVPAQVVTSAELVPLPTDQCPDCGGPVTALEVEQGALFRHGGAGATDITIRRYCPCGWRSNPDKTAGNPRRFTLGATP